VTDLEGAVAAADAAIFRERAHALRSSAAHLGAVALFELCLGCRGVGADELAARGADQIARFRAELGRLRTALLAEVGAPRSAPPGGGQQATLTGAAAVDVPSRAQRRS
jgi:two-component system sensor histidine kinase RpfC